MELPLVPMPVALPKATLLPPSAELASAFLFPPGATSGTAVVGPNGITYIFDGEKWVSQPAGGGGGRNVISTSSFGCVSDFVELNGAVSWTGTKVTVTGANFVATDTGKKLVMPFGGGGSGGDAPAVVTIASVIDSQNVTIVEAATNNPFSGATRTMSLVAEPTGIVINSAGSGGAKVGDVLTMQGGVYAHPATFYTTLIKAASATVVNGGDYPGPPNWTVYLQGTTGKGRRPLWSATTDATGHVSGALTLVDAGLMYVSPDALLPTPPQAHEPLEAAQLQYDIPGSWTAGSNTVICGGVATNVVSLVRPGFIVIGQFPVGTTVTGVTGANIVVSANATASGTGTVSYAANRYRANFNATFGLGATTITSVGTVPSQLQVGALIYGSGLVGTADPTADPTTQTRVTAIAGTTITISQPTIASTGLGTGLVSANPALIGVTADVTYVPGMLVQKELGVYSTLPTFPAAMTGGASGVTITSPTTPISVAFGTDNAGNFTSWANAVASAVTGVIAGIGGTVVGTAIKAVMEAGRYLTTGSINLQLLNTLGLAVQCDGAVLFAVDVASNQRVLDTRSSVNWWLKGLSVIGCYYFPPQVGLATGRLDLSHASTFMRYDDLSFSGAFTLAAVSTLCSESGQFVHCIINNKRCPTQAPGDSGFMPPYGFIADGWNHWQIPSSFAAATFPVDTRSSFIGLLLENLTTRCYAGFPFAIAGASALRMIDSYAVTYGLPPVQCFGEDCSAYMFLHCESFVQDQVMLCAIANNIAQFTGEFFDQASNATNAFFACDTQGFFGNKPIISLQSTVGTLKTYFKYAGAEVFDRPKDLSGNTWTGDIILGGLNYQGRFHLLTSNVNRRGTLIEGEDQTKLETVAGEVVTDSVVSRQQIQALNGMSVSGDLVSSQFGFVLTDGYFEYGRWNQAGITIDSGVMLLAADPATALQAATKQYVDAHAGGVVGEAPTDGNAYMRANSGWSSGGTITNDIIMNSTSGIDFAGTNTGSIRFTGTSGAGMHNDDIGIAAWNGVGFQPLIGGTTFRVPLGVNGVWVDVRNGILGSIGPLNLVNAGGGAPFHQVGMLSILRSGSDQAISLLANSYYQSNLNPTIAAGGSGWAVNDRAIDSFNNTYTVNTVSAGAVTAITASYLSARIGSSPPTNPVTLFAVAPSVGTGLTVNLTYTGAGKLILNNAAGGGNVVSLQSNASDIFTVTTGVATVTFGNALQVAAASGIVGGASGPTITWGAGVPSFTAPSGSIRVRTDGTAAARIYVNQSGSSWAAVAGV
jgi:hypothetical protein